MIKRKTNKLYLFGLVIVVGIFVFYRHEDLLNNPLTSYFKSNNSTVLFPVKPLVIWSMDYHIGPIADLKDVLEPLGVRFIDKSFSGHCHITKTCEGAKTLKVVDSNTAFGLSDPTLIPRFYEAYKNDTEMLSVDAFVCLMMAAICELFEPFNKPLLIIVVIRYEWGRGSAERWPKWNQNLKRMSENPRNIIAANNMYDAEYLRYFTGIKPILLEGYNGYSKSKYSPEKPGFILGPVHDSGRNFSRVLSTMFNESCRKINCNVELIPLRSRYPTYNFGDISTHKGIVHVPYQTSVMSILEQYRMNIPLFFPSLDLLSHWQHKYLAVNEKTWIGANNYIRSNKSKIPAHPSQAHLPDPNDDVNFDAIRYWLAFSDFYRLPHIWYFNSTDELAHRLQTVTLAELNATSRLMNEYNTRFRGELVEKWTGVLRKIADNSPNNPH